MIELVDRRSYLDQSLEDLTKQLGSGKQTQKLKLAIVDHLVERPDSLLLRARDQLITDLRGNGPQVVQSVALAASAQLGVSVDPASFSFRIEPIDDQDFRTESDLVSRLGLTVEEAHKIIERGLLGVGGLNMRLAEMEAFEAVTGFQENELPLFESKLTFLAN